MVLVDSEIKEALKRHPEMIAGFDEECVQPASYDLRIGRHIYAPPNPDHPIDLTNGGGGAFRLPPYGNAVITTHENLKLPKNMVGRIGLKSGFARRGLWASTGPQIDPGFEGKLFVSLFNMTAVPHVVGYLETFLTIEFSMLDREPDQPYEGPYQGKYEIGPEVLDSLVRLEGLTLSQMQSQFTELAQHVREWQALASRFDEFITGMTEQTRVMGELVKRLDGRTQIEHGPIEARQLTIDQAKDEILKLFKDRKRLFYSDIAEALQLDFATVIKACEELQKGGLIEGAPNGETRTKRPRRKHSSRSR